MDPFRPKALVLATALATFLAVRAIKKKSLTKLGAMVGFVVGFSIVATGLRGVTLFAFYQIGSWATKYKMTVKQGKDATACESATRGPSQVLACSIAATVLSMMHAIWCGSEDAIDMNAKPLASRLTLAVLSHHACCLGDTLASELGILSSAAPVLVTKPWKRVPPGTNGGITLIGTIWSLVGGALMGLFTVAMDLLSGINPLQSMQKIAFGAICGFIGSMIDSFLGATLQMTYFDVEKKLVYHDQHLDSAKPVAGNVPLLNNEQVNFVSVVATMFLGGWIIGPMIF